MSDTDLIKRSQKRLDYATEILREIVAELCEALDTSIAEPSQPSATPGE